MEFFASYQTRKRVGNVRCSDRADECKDIPGDQYNASWDVACENGGLTEAYCLEIKKNPVKLDYVALGQENSNKYYIDVIKDGKAHVPLNKTRDHGCDEYNPN